MGYGKKVIDYYGFSEEKRAQWTNPMCNTFPTKVSCNLVTFGTGGNEETYNDYFILQGIGTRFLTSDMKAYLKNCSIGDIFVLYQMSKNTHTSFFYKLLDNVSGDSEDDDSEKKA